MTYEQLKDKALSLPLEPGVYIMRDKNDKVIYVGKAKKLKNRVSQYFQDTASHSPKTRLMVSKIDRFDVIVAASEFEALVLECSLIKRHMPKYNILLKDDKGYPYIRLDMKEAYPKITMVNKVSNDGAEYYGPYGSRSITSDIIEAIRSTLKLPNCSKQFPRDLEKGRACLNHHMNQCAGWCTGKYTQEDYLQTMEQARQLLLGNYKQVAEQLKQQMLTCSENLDFEQAAVYRDRYNAVQSLGQKQLVTAGTFADTDVIGYAETETKACFAVLHYAGGNLIDKDYEIFSVPDDRYAAVSSLLKQYYLALGCAPKRVLLPFDFEDKQLFSQLLQQNLGVNSKLIVPQRGNNAYLVELANKNAFEEAQRVTDKDEKLSVTLVMLGKMLCIDPPRRIESYDISNISGTDIVGAMVVFKDGKPHKSDYKHFKLENMDDQDDYASMHQVLTRRFTHYVKGDKGFDEAPSILLIDGGVNHARVACDALRALELAIPVFGMVKDDRHRTKALVTSEGDLIAIDSNAALFSFIGNIQEETHRFAISYHRKLRSKRLRYSQLDQIPGIGPKRKQDLLKIYKSLQAIVAAPLEDLQHHLPQDAAAAVYRHFHEKGEQ